MKKRDKVKENAPSCWHIPPLVRSDNKYTRGHVLILGGAQMTGAARLAALAAQRAGAGLVTIAATPASWPIYAASMLSVITRACDAKQWGNLVADDRINPILIGPGAGANARTRNAVLSAAKAGKQLILDADALTLLAGDAALRKAIMRTPKIITPHEGEYGRLAMALKLDVTAEKPLRAAALAKALNAVVVLKGSETIIADAIGNLLVTHAPAWLATGGTGDVLAGIIAALAGQGMEPFEAAAAGVWLHAKAAHSFGPGMIAEDIIGAIPEKLRALGR
jgi:NAD(P)H-hydrate epimerase